MSDDQSRDKALSRPDPDKTVDRRSRAIQIPRSWLKVLSGPQAGQTACIEKPVFQVGTMRSNDLVIEDVTASRVHFSISREREGFVVRDLKSTNGLSVNDIRVREAILSSGNILTMGHTQLEFTVGRELYEVDTLEQDNFQGIIGQSQAIRRVFSQIQRYARFPADVLIQGETGTGKELVARALHRLCGRPGPFEEFDCGVMLPEMISPELLGYVRGAFTGAVHNYTGVIARANGGTLFLDEVGELPASDQTKLLRVLQERTFKPIGSSTVLRSDFRLIAATNRDLAEPLNQKRFREDLYHRLNVLEIRLPPLRERREDIPLLLHHFIHERMLELGSDSYDFPQVSASVMTRLQELPWPGNVRQLKNYALRLVADGREGPLAPGEFLSEGRLYLSEPEKPQLADSLLQLALHAAQAVPSGANRLRPALERVRDEVSRHLISMYMKRARNQKEAAQLLGIDPAELSRILSRLAASSARTGALEEEE